MQLRRINNRIRAAVCLLLCLGLLLPCIALSEDTQKTRERYIFDRLTEDLQARGVQHPEAVVCGILGNIYYETGASPFNYNPATVGDYSGGVATSGGICGWHNSRWDALKDFCAARGHNWDNLEDQCDFLVWELYESGDYNDTRGRLLQVDNDIHGAWYAAYMFCYWFEGPADRIRSAVTRGHKAEEFWREYVNSSDVPVTTGEPEKSTLRAEGITHPDNRKYTDYISSFSLKGRVLSNYPITFVRVYVVNAAGQVVSGYKYVNNTGAYLTLSFSPAGKNGELWDGRCFDVYWDGADNAMAFSAIDYPGSYCYCIDAADVSGKALALRYPFHVISATTCLYAFDCNGGAAIASGTAIFGSALTLPTPQLRPGWLFDGWSDGESIHPAGSDYTVLRSDITFTALWRECPHVHWDAGVVTEPAVGAGGYTTYTCQDCGLTEQRDFTAPLLPDIPGDVNGDYILSEADLHLLARHVSGIATLTDLSLADVNGDGMISAADLTALAGMIKK